MASHLLITLGALLALQQSPPAAAPKPVAPRAPVTTKKPVSAPKDEKSGKEEKDGKDAKDGKDGKKDEAAPESAPLLTKEQTEARALGAQALALFRSNEFDKAGDLATKALALDPKFELAIRLLGWSAVAKGDDRKAEETLTRALNMNPADGELQFLLASCHKRLQEWGAAKDLLADLLKREGPTVRVLVEMGECCLGEEDWDGALAVLASARELAPKDLTVVERIVEVHEAHEEWEKAAVELRTLVAAAPKEGPPRYRLVQALLNANKLADAANELEEAAKALGDDPQPHKLLETLYAGPFPNESRLEFHRNWLKEWNLRRR